MIRLLLAALVGALALPAASQPDLRLTATSEQTRAQPGDAFNVDWSVRNVGTSLAADVTVGFYLSDDAAYSPDDAVLSTEDVGDLEADADEDGTEGVNAPDLPPGGYYLLVVADPGETVGDGDRSNNTVVVPFTLGTPATGPDLEARALAVDGSSDPGTSVSVTATVRNVGAADAGASTAAVYLSADPYVSDDDDRLGTDSVGALPSGGEREVSFSFVTSDGLPDPVYVLVRADDLGEIAEPDETDNTAAARLEAPVPSEASFDGLYVETFDGMGTAVEAPLPAGWTANGQTTTDLRGGRYFSPSAPQGVVNFGSGPEDSAGERALGLNAESGQFIGRIVNETGGPVSELEVGYNLEIYRRAAYEDYGTRVSLAYAVDGGPWVSVDATRFIRAYNEDAGPTGFAFPPGGSVGVTATLDLAAPVPAGATVAFRLNVLSYLFDDDDEGDGPPGPRIAVDNFFVTDTPGEGLVFTGTGELDVYATPVGGTGPGVRVRAYRPFREAFPYRDVTAVLSGENPGDFRVENVDGPFENAIVPFEVRLTPTAQGERTAVLRFESDGNLSAPILLRGIGEAPGPGFPTGPDGDFLVVEAQEVEPTYIYGHGAFRAEARVENVGGGLLADATAVLYLSDDPVLSEDDVPFGSGNAYGPASGDYTLVRPSGNLPVDAEAGLHYVIVAVDPADEVPENLETNNTAAFQIELTEDGGEDDPSGGAEGGVEYRLDRLEVEGETDRYTDLPSGTAGATISVRALVANVGGTDAAATTLRLFVNGPCATWSTCLNEDEVARVDVAPLAAGTFRWVDLEVELPETLLGGVHDLEAYIDTDAWDPTRSPADAAFRVDVTPIELPPLAGTVSVPGDYARPADAVAALHRWGVSGPTRVELAPGTYPQRYRIGSVPGLSAASPVTVTAAGGGDVVLAPPVARYRDHNYVVALEPGANHIEVSGLTMAVVSQNGVGVPPLQTAVRIAEGLEAVAILDNVIEGSGAGSPPPRYSQDAAMSTAIRVEDRAGPGLRIERNRISGVSGGIEVRSESLEAPTGADGPRIVGNTVTGGTGDGLYLLYGEAAVVTDNVFETERYGVYLSDVRGATRVERNRVVGGVGGMYLSRLGSTETARSAVRNNFVVSTGGYAPNTQSNLASLYLVAPVGVDVDHNSVVARRDARAAIYLQSFSDPVRIRMRNNVFMGMNESLAFETVADFRDFESGHNDYWTQGPVLASVDFDDYTTLPAFLAALDAKDPNGTEGAGSFSANPRFEAPAAGDLHTEAPVLQGAGLDVGVTDDVDDQARPRPAGTAPDVGADESGPEDEPVPMAGTFSIPGDFATLEAALAEVADQGVGGEVRLALADGTYAGRVEVGLMPGASTDAPVVITSASGDPAGVVFEAAATSGADDYVVRIADAPHVHLEALTLAPTARAYRTGLVLSGDVTGVRVAGVVVRSPVLGDPGGAGGLDSAALDADPGLDAEGPEGLDAPDPDAGEGLEAPSAAAPQSRFAVRTDAPLTGAGLEIVGSQFVDGLSLVGDAAARPTGVRVDSNAVALAGLDGLALSGLEAPSVVANTVRARRFGIALDGVPGASRVVANRVLANAGAVYVTRSDAGVEAPALLANTFATTRQRRDGSGQSLDVRFSDHWRIVHNSVVATDGRAALFVRDSEGLEVRNNAAAAYRGAVAYEVRGALPGLESGYNALVAQGALGRVQGTDYADLGSFVEALDAHDEGPEGEGTFVANPRFVDAPSGDLHTTSPALRDAGLDVGIDSDVDGDPRPAGSAPDVGADEVDPAAVAAARASAVPVEFGLEAPFPNPTGGSARVPFAVAEAGPVTVEVLDLLGRRVAVLAEGRVEAGAHEAALEASTLAPGVYVVRMRAEGFEASRRITVVR